MSYRHKLAIFFLKSFNVHKYAYKQFRNKMFIGNFKPSGRSFS